MAMPLEHLDHIQSFQNTDPLDISARQMPLRALYKTAPQKAWVYDHAQTTCAQVPAAHPIHGHVICGLGVPVEIPISVHKAVGGESDFPCPGEVLAASLASCFDTAIRMIADLMGMRLEHLQVHARLGADVRGTLRTGQDVPVGFQTAEVIVEVHAGPNVPPARLDALLDAAERSCVILQTLRAPPTVMVERVFDPRPETPD